MYSLWRTHRRTNDLVIGVSAIAVSAAVASQVNAPWLRWGDHRLFQLLNQLPDSWYRPLWTAQLLGVLGVPLLLAAVLVWWRFPLALGMVALVPAKLVVEYNILKVVVHHQRPGVVVPGAILRNVPAAGQAFPSGHAVILFGVAMLASPYLSRRGSAIVFTLAAVAACARVYLGAHTPVDVLGGTAAGIALGALLNLTVGLSPARARNPETGRTT